MKIFNFFLLFLLAFMSTSYVCKSNDSFYIEISQSWGDDDWSQNKKWIIRSNRILYMQGCKTDTFPVKNIDKSNKLYRILDSLKYYQNYSCKEFSSLHSNSKYRLFSSWTFNKKDGYFNFSIINCQLNKNIDSLIEVINPFITKVDSKIPNIQEGISDCKCVPYKVVKVYED